MNLEITFDFIPVFSGSAVGRQGPGWQHCLIKGEVRRNPGDNLKVIMVLKIPVRKGTGDAILPGHREKNSFKEVDHAFSANRV